VLWSPLQEIPHIGRLPVFVGCLFFFVVLQIPIIFAPNFATVAIFRFITGFLGAPPLSGGGAALCDMYDSLHIPYALGWVSLVLDAGVAILIRCHVFQRLGSCSRLRAHTQSHNWIFRFREARMEVASLRIDDGFGTFVHLFGE